MKILVIVSIMVACGCGRSELDGPFATQNIAVVGAPDASASGVPNVTGLGNAGNPGSAGHSGTAGASGAATPGATGTTGGFGGALQFCKTDVDCSAGTPRCCSVGAVMVCEPGPCVG